MDFKNFSVLLAILMIVMFAIGAVSAESIDDSDVSVAFGSADDVSFDDMGSSFEGEVSSDDSSFTSLENTIFNADGSQISLDRNYSFNQSEDDISGVKISKSLIIDGNGHSINGLKESRLFLVSNANLILKNITFINGFSEEYGAGINLVNANLTLINCCFSYNSANYGGSAIYSYNSIVNITDCTFSFNGADDLYVLGGAVYADNSSVNVEDCEFFNNVADEGGALYSFNSTLNIDNSIFYNNLVRWYGGAVWSEEKANINNSQFYNNNAIYKGGAIHYSYFWIHFGFALINNSYIFNNSADYGGAISSSSVNPVRIYNSEIYANTATYGAAISRLSRNAIEITDSKLYNNTAKNGTILYSFTVGITEFKNNIIENNTGETGVIYYIVSGRINNITSNYAFNFINCTIKDNDAIKGLFYTYFDILNISDSTITYNGGCYNKTIIYIMEIGEFFQNNNWWGVETPDFDDLVYINNKSDGTNKVDDDYYIPNGCTSAVLQIDNESFAFSFRIDSPDHFCVNIIKQDGGVLQRKSDLTYFGHTYISDDGWVFGSGGNDDPYCSERLEAFAKIMAKENCIIEELIKRACDLKQVADLGHFLVKAPNGTYVAVDYCSSRGRTIEYGVLNPGEFIISPNNYDYYIKGNLSDLNLSEKLENLSHYTIDTDLNEVFNVSDYVFAAKYLTAMDKFRTNTRNCDFTFYYYTEITEGYETKVVDAYISNDDGSMAFPDYHEALTSKDVLFGDKYVYYEIIPIIMDQVYLGRFNITSSPIPIKTKLIASDMNIIYGAGSYLTVKLMTDVSGKVLKNQNLSIRISNKLYTIKTNDQGIAKLAINLNPGTYAVSISFDGFNGSQDYLPSSKNIKILVKKANVKLIGSNKGFKIITKIKNYVVTLKTNKGVLLKNANLYLRIGGKTFVAKTNSKGKATFKISNFYRKGKFTAKITFKGNNYYNKLTISKKITIVKDKVKFIAKNKVFKVRTKIKKYSVTLKTIKGVLIKKVRLYLRIGGKTFVAKTNSKGKAIFKISKFYRKGKFAAKISFKGTKYYIPLSQTKRVSIR